MTDVAVGGAPTRADALALDAEDPLAGFVDMFVSADPRLCYLDGNSLGRLPKATRDRLADVIDLEWGVELVRGWERWIELPTRVGDELGAALLGAGPGQVVVCDSTTVNLYKLAAAAVDAQPGRQVVVTDDGNFPTDRYVIQGLAAERNLEVRWVPTDSVDGVAPERVAEAVRDDTALVTLSLVDFRSGALADLAAVTEQAHRVGALVLWDLSHAAGAVPVDLDSAGVDLAVGCTYKYLNAGPGAPAYAYVAAGLQGRLRQPVWGWFGQRDQFTMGPAYEPDAGIGQILTGTPSPFGLAAVEEGVRLLADAGITQVRAKGQALTSLLIDLADAWLAPLGFEVASPRDPKRRGAHVALAHPDALAIGVALRRTADVVPDVRPPNLLRLGPAPLTSRFVEVWDALDRLRELVVNGGHRGSGEVGHRVT
jgi:kynureninase